MDQDPAAVISHRGVPDPDAPVVWWPAALAIGTGLAAFAVGTVAESLIIRAVDGNRSELEWLSDAVISTTLASVAYLWLHLRATRKRLLSLVRERAAIDEQLRLAAEIQRDLLPDVPEATPGFRWSARMIPAGHVGGDFYDFLQPTEGTVLAILADVSGKGIPAALILSSLKTLFRTIARETVDPAAIAERISGALNEEHGGVPYATAIVARIETSPPRLAYVNAGHPAGHLLRNGTADATLESGGQPLGLFPGATYATINLGLSPGSIGVLVTDGITEAFEAGPMTLSQILGASMERSTARGLPAEICDHLLRAAAAGPGPRGVPDWQDDRTVFVFAVEPPA
jgi:sigma-B regulation protein RsbU (phosphoserine phosphatase)